MVEKNSSFTMSILGLFHPRRFLIFDMRGEFAIDAEHAQSSSFLSLTYTNIFFLF